MAMTNAERQAAFQERNRIKQAAYKERMYSNGMVQFQRWVPADKIDELKAFATALCEGESMARWCARQYNIKSGPNLAAFAEILESKS